VRRHSPRELERFVEAVDEALTEPASILVIGGAAAALASGATRATDDIDTFHPLTPDVDKAVEAARRSTGLNIPVSFAAVADAPYDFEDRLIPIRGLHLKRLTLVVPERHDLVLMKTLRGIAGASRHFDCVEPQRCRATSAMRIAAAITPPTANRPTASTRSLRRPPGVHPRRRESRVEVPRPVIGMSR
jgi:hypothetical protein